MKYNGVKIMNNDNIKINNDSESIKIAYECTGLLRGHNIHKRKIFAPSSDGQMIADSDDEVCKCQINENIIIIRDVCKSKLQCHFTASNWYGQKGELCFTLGKYTKCIKQLIV